MNEDLASAPLREITAPPDEQRLGRICELLSKLVVADWADRVVTESPASSAPPARLPAADKSDRQRVMDYLALVGGQATPAMIRATLGLPRMRLYRAVQPMLASGRIVATGHTSTISYRLGCGAGIDPSRN